MSLSTDLDQNLRIKYLGHNSQKYLVEEEKNRICKISDEVKSLLSINCASLKVV